MRNVFVIVISVLSLFAQCAQTNCYKIQGNIQGVNEGWVWMKQKTETGYRILDSAWIKQGQFEFDGDLPDGIQSVNLYVEMIPCMKRQQRAIVSCVHSLKLLREALAREQSARVFAWAYCL